MGVIFVVFFIAYLSGFIYMLISSSEIKAGEIHPYKGVTPVVSNEIDTGDLWVSM